jgi:type III secretory pathway component EscT
MTAMHVSAEVVQWLQLCGLVIARLLPIVALTPVFGGQGTPPRFRFAVATALGLGLCGASPGSVERAVSAFIYGGLLLKELLIGLAFAVFIFFCFRTFTATGALLDLVRGSQALTTFDPHVRRNESALGAFFGHLALVFFLSLGGHRYLYAALSDSLRVLPPFDDLATLGARLFDADRWVAQSANILTIAVRLAMPAIIVTLLMDFALGLGGRLTRPLDVQLVSFTLRGSLVVAVVLFSIGALVLVLEDQLVNLLVSLKNTIADCGVAHVGG